MTLTNRYEVARAVRRNPGHTAYFYYRSEPFARTRMGWVYDAFKRAVRMGVVEAHPDGHRTVYYPAKEERS